MDAFLLARWNDIQSLQEELDQNRINGYIPLCALHNALQFCVTAIGHIVEFNIPIPMEFHQTVENFVNFCMYEMTRLVQAIDNQGADPTSAQ